MVVNVCNRYCWFFMELKQALVLVWFHSAFQTSSTPLSWRMMKKLTEYLFHDEFKVEWLCKMLCFVAFSAELCARLLLLRHFSRVRLCANP